MKKVFMVRMGAFGDHVHMSNVIKAFHLDGWEITFLYNYKGAQVHTANPRVHHHKVLEMSPMVTRKKKKEFEDTLISAKENFDRFINFSKSIEDALIAYEGTAEYFWPLKKRRKKNTNICYYDQSMLWAGLTDDKYMGWTGEVFFTNIEHEFIKAWMRKYIGDRHFILWGMRGSMYQKAVYPLAKDICNEWLKRHPDSVIVTTGDEFCQQWEWEHERVIHKSGRMPYRQALHLARYADMVVTPETGLGIGAGAFQTPKIMMLTAASLKNVVGNDINDYSLQSDAWCSPCTRAIYNVRSCPLGEPVLQRRLDDQCNLMEKPVIDQLPICVYFDKERVLDRMEEVYKDHGRYNEWRRNEPLNEEPVYM